MADIDGTRREWDAFISHAREDKDSFVLPLASALASLGAKIWYDEFTLKIGDSLSESIDRGLASSRYGIVVLSRSFMSKPWPKRELQGLVNRELDGHIAVVPIWHEVGRQDVSDFSPPLADKLAVRTSDAGAIDIALQILQVIRPDLYDQQPRAQLEKLANGEAVAELQEELASLRVRLSEYQCPYCKAQMYQSVDAPLDPEEKHWDTVRTFDCGYQEFGGEKRRLCPKDPDFPQFDDYELVYAEHEKVPFARWVCNALPRTNSAHLVPLPQTFGPTQERAAEEMVQEYKQRANPWLRPLGDVGIP